MKGRKFSPFFYFEIYRINYNMIVKESISFQRGKNPKEVLGIGYDHIMHVNDILDVLNCVMTKFNVKSKIEIITQNEKEFVAGFEHAEHVEKREEETWLYTLGYYKNSGYYSVSALQLLPVDKYGTKLRPYESADIENAKEQLFSIVEL
jgi:hypothetical protein